MRVLHITPALPWDFLESTGITKGRDFAPALRQKLHLVGGGGVYPVGLCRALSRSMDVELVSPAPFSARVEVGESFHLTLVRASYGGPFSPSNPLAWPPRRLVESCDIIHIHQIHKALSNTTVLESIPRGKPVYVTHHAGNGLSLNLYGAYEAHLAVSRYAAGLYREGIPRSRTIYGGGSLEDGTGSSDMQTQTDGLIETMEAHDGPVLLFVGIFRRNKNVGDLMSATTRLVREGTNPLLVLCGEAWTRREMEELISSVPDLARGNIIFSSFLPEGEKARAYSACDVFVSASSHEYLGLVFIEAMTHGKPVVARAVGGVPEVVDNGSTGILYEARGSVSGSDALAGSLLALMENRTLARRMGRRGRERARRFFTWERAAERTIEAYGEARK